ncbi:GntR family transcriptional regulator [Paenibacillus turicensis]|uniref:GntR family transcriptional regulator n=1 Tax=Paenibacillus turicensis TaxID=160487 RepID=A0ABS4FQ07_9BACL|nr:GntR family transcriptional regulator [Paenibacillus turicensis]
MFELDVRSRKPIYEQLMDKIKEMIVYGVLQVDEQLPSVRTLSTQLTVNPNTIQKAYRELEREGYIYSMQGKGSFVAEYTGGQNSEMLIQLQAGFVKLIAEASYSGLNHQDVAQAFEAALKQVQESHTDKEDKEEDEEEDKEKEKEKEGPHDSH